MRPLRAGRGTCTAVAAAARDGLVLGRTDGTFAARESATRPQLHAIVSRLREVLSSEGLIPGDEPLHPNGRILRRDGGVNHGHDWHLVEVEIVDMTMELCHGTAAYIDRVGLDAGRDAG